MNKQELFTQHEAQKMEAVHLTLALGYYKAGKVVFTKRSQKDWSFSPGFSGRLKKLRSLVVEMVKELDNQK